MTGVFPLSQSLNYNIRHQPVTVTVTVVYYGTESLGYLRIIIWELVPIQLINGESLEAFISGKKKWEPKSALAHSVKHTK